jgi:hypothetical protein
VWALRGVLLTLLLRPGGSTRWGGVDAGSRSLRHVCRREAVAL